MQRAFRKLLNKKFQQKHEPASVVFDFLEHKKQLPGYGHKVYKNEDPRARVLLQKAEELRFGSVYTAKALDIERELEKQKGRKLPLNIDGAIAALLCEMGFDARIGKAIFILARIPSMIANVIEEMDEGKTYRRLDDGDIEYVG